MISEKEGGIGRESNVTNNAPLRSSEVRSAFNSHRGGGGKEKGGGDSTHTLYKWWQERQVRTDHQ